jgi:hypothetical protein
MSASRELVIKIGLSDPSHLWLDTWDDRLVGDGDKIGQILRNLADSWEGQMVVVKRGPVPLVQPDGNVVGSIQVTGEDWA